MTPENSITRKKLTSTTMALIGVLILCWVLTLGHPPAHAFTLRYARDIVVMPERELADPCSGVAPQISEATVSTPNPPSLISRPPIYYVAGDQLDIALTIPSCASISAVTARGNPLPPESSISVDPPAMYYSIVSNQSLPDNRRRVTLRLHFDNTGWGLSDPLQVIVSNPRSPDTPVATFSFTLVQVQTTGVSDTAISFSEAELNNQFNTVIYNLFGDDGRYEKRDENGEIVQVLYDPSYFPLTITEEGIYFWWRFKIEKNNWCNPTATVEGRFTLGLAQDEQDIDADGDTSETIVKVLWHKGDDIVSEPDVDLDFAWTCDVVGSFGLFAYWIAVALAEDSVQASIATLIQNEVTAMAAGLDCGETSCIDTISSFETLLRELRVHLLLLAEQATIAVPYHGIGDDNPIERGFALNPGDEVALIAHGWAQVCGGLQYGLWPDCPFGKEVIGPNGLPNQGPFYIYSLSRDPTSLALPAENVGALVASFATPSLWEREICVGFGGLSCGSGSGSDSTLQFWTVGTISSITVNPLSLGGWLYFGMNEPPDPFISPSRYGNGVVYITVVWVP